MSNTNRDENGKFLPGHSLGGPGRPSRERELAMLDAIKSAFPPEVITAKLKRALELAEQQGSARGMVACLEFAAAYSLGKPVAKVQATSTKFEELLAKLGSNEPVDEDGQRLLKAQD